MRLPRDLSGVDLAKALSRYGYRVTRQTGSYLRLTTDLLAADSGDRFELVLTNPPFGKKSSTTIVGEEGKVSKERDIVERGDFWTTTSNKQLNFVQHVKTLLRQNGRAAVVVPDNVLFEGRDERLPRFACPQGLRPGCLHR